jgi:hypothetical protein
VAEDVAVTVAGTPGWSSDPGEAAAAAASGRQLGLLWGAVALILLALAPLAPLFASALPGALPACPLKSLTGVPCPGCGTTRAALALAHFDFAAAFAVSPLAAAAWCGLIAGGLLAGALALTGRPVPSWPRFGRRGEIAWRVAVVAALAANWVYLVLHGS